MKKGLILIVMACAMGFIGCKKSQPQYCYKIYNFFEEYPSTGTPADSFYVVDTTHVFCLNEFKGDTFNSGVVNTWTLNGNIYYKGTTFEVYQH
jgi:hypothetical protein